jgi:pyruvate dehydrogenase E2 component (dihydrolipoamide acetyltransferase)
LATITGSGPNGRITKDDVNAAVQRAAAVPSAAPRRLDVSPVARRLAREHALDLHGIAGSAPNGRIIRRDIEQALAERAAVMAQPQMQAAVPEHSTVTRQPLGRLRRIAAERMAESKRTIPHFYLALDVDMARALDLRESLKRRGSVVSINDLVLRAVALALGQVPALNARYDDHALVLNPAINLAVAVAVGDGTDASSQGLVTPVVHGCEALSLHELAARAAERIAQARAGRLRPQDLADATFTVSNLGMFGIRQFQAIVNPPQVGILAVGAMQRVPVFDAYDRVTAAQRITLTLSADHRATDGAEAAAFLAAVRGALEDGYMLAEAPQAAPI